ncbi:pirin family protein [uncultured Jatrophihabitans sp.]|uniref:pirin family protein n=1 Tax=uncultured Jatrophihabitans sp. TaxID=1610747 RepID=UPI0035CC6AE3
MIVRAGERFRTDTPDYVTLHCFSSGAHYDADRLAWGPVVAVDEHLVPPGGGFDWHPHRGVHIVSWVLNGALRHKDSTGAVHSVEPGQLFVQSTGDGLRHRETNASDATPLRMVQIMVLGVAAQSAGAADVPAQVGPVTVDVVQGAVHVADGLVFGTRGSRAGDLSDEDTALDGEALVLHMTEAASPAPS